MRSGCAAYVLLCVMTLLTAVTGVSLSGSLHTGSLSALHACAAREEDGVCCFGPSLYIPNPGGLGHLADFAPGHLEVGQNPSQPNLEQVSP